MLAAVDQLLTRSRSVDLFWQERRESTFAGVQIITISEPAPYIYINRENVNVIHTPAPYLQNNVLQNAAKLNLYRQLAEFGGCVTTHMIVAASGEHRVAMVIQFGHLSRNDRSTCVPGQKTKTCHTTRSRR